jgi:hypothetical protein
MEVSPQPGELNKKKRNRRVRRWILLAVVAGIALQFAFWGRPLPVRYTVRQDGASSPLTWTIERRNPAGRGRTETWHARETSGGGTMDAFETPQGNFLRPGLETQPKRWLVICLDGVPLSVMQDLWDRGHFREFARPTAVVSVYPSDSEAALSAALHAGPPPGYEHLYYDHARNEMRGGWWVTLSGYHIPYIHLLDYDPPGWAKAIPYLLPYKTYRADLGRMRKEFLASRADVFIAHISSTDSLLHMFSAREIEPLFFEFENMARELYLDARGELGVLIFSDHGNTGTPSRAIPLEKSLAARGWKLRDRLDGPRDVVVPTYGLIGFAAVYCDPKSAEALARDLVQIEGVDLVAKRVNDASIAIVFNAAGGRTVSWTNPGSGLRFGYPGAASWGAAEDPNHPANDPLNLDPVYRRLRADGRLGPNDKALDADLFSATWQSAYPDAAGRIREWAMNHAQNPSNLLVSLKPGYFHGKGVFQKIVNFAGTHGALDARSSLGFAMGTKTLPPAVRLGDLLPKEFLSGKN